MCVLSLRESQYAFSQRRWGWAIADPDEGQVQVDLDFGALWQARGDQRWRVIICHRGVVWITQECDVADYVLQEGEIFIVTLPGLVMVQALEPALVTVVTPSITARPYAGDYRAFR